MQRLMILLAMATATFAPTRLLACAVCGVYGEDASNVPFLQGTALLSLTPLVMIGGTVFYLFRRHQRANQDTGAPLPDLPGPPLSRPHRPILTVVPKL